MSKKYEHTFSVCFEVCSNLEADDVTFNEMVDALQERVNELRKQEYPSLDSFDWIYTTD